MIRCSGTTYGAEKAIEWLGPKRWINKTYTVQKRSETHRSQRVKDDARTSVNRFWRLSRTFSYTSLDGCTLCAICFLSSLSYDAYGHFPMLLIGEVSWNQKGNWIYLLHVVLYHIKYNLDADALGAYWKHRRRVGLNPSNTAAERLSISTFWGEG